MDREGAKAKTPTGSRAGAAFSAYAWSLALVAAATAVGNVGRVAFALPDIVMFYILVVMIAAVRFGRGPSVLAACLSAVSYDFFFVPPLYTLTVADVRYTLTFVMMLVTALVVSGLTLRMRKQEQQARTEELRSSLLSAVSHDLRTPLAAITGASTTLLDASGRLTETQQKELVEAIYEEAERLERLVGNLLDMTQVSSGSLRVKREWIPLEEMVASALTRLERRLSGRPIDVELPDNLPLISADPILFEQVLVNLLDNVVKHAPPGTGIEVRARAAPASVSIEISDRGPGLPQGDEERIFEKFFRGPEVRAAGAGLGLAICRGIVAAHGGTLVAENREGGGATFRIELPIVGSAPPLPTEAPPEAR